MSLTLNDHSSTSAEYSTIYGMPIEDVIFMAQAIRDKAYTPEDPDWQAFKAGFEYAKKLRQDELNVATLNIIQSQH